MSFYIKRAEVLVKKKVKYQDTINKTSQVAQTVKRLAYNVGDLGSIPESGRYSGEGNGNPLQYSCLENPMDGEA